MPRRGAHDERGGGSLGGGGGGQKQSRTRARTRRRTRRARMTAIGTLLAGGAAAAASAERRAAAAAAAFAGRCSAREEVASACSGVRRVGHIDGAGARSTVSSFSSSSSSSSSALGGHFGRSGGGGAFAFFLSSPPPPLMPSTMRLQSRQFRSTSAPFLSAASASSSPADGEKEPKAAETPASPPKKNTKKKTKPKFRVNPNLEKEVDLDALTAEFDKMARAEGFDPTTASFADAKSFDDEFDYENLPERFDFDDLDLDLDGDEGDFADEEEEDDDDDYLDFGDADFEDFSGISDGADEDGKNERAARAADMASRIAAARSDLDRGRVTASSSDLLDLDADAFSQEVTESDLRRLGFRRESNPFGDDETPRKDSFRLITDAMTCSACGADFQCRNETKPGYLPREKFDVQFKLGKIEEMQRLQEKAEGTGEWSPEDEIEWLIQSEGGGGGGSAGAGTDGSGGGADDGVPLTADGGIDIHAVAETMGLDLAELSSEKKKVICRRCHRLQNFGDVEDSLRPGWTEEPLLSQESFRDLLRPIREKECVVVALVDLFDFSGSVLPELDAIAGDNPVVLAANKADLLPSKMGQTRAENWVRRELEYLGVKSIGNFGGAVRLVSCKTGFGMSSLLGKVRSLAEERECDVYVVGAANAGKSTLINHILDRNDEKKLAYKLGKKKLKKRAGNANARKGDVTVSPLPGTTLKFIKVDLGNGVNLYDTPGLLVPGTLTQRLTPAELKIVVPKKEVEPVTFRVASGKCVLVGGLARIEVIGDSKPFLFTFFVGNDIKLHPTDVAKADDFVAKHAGEMLTPPLEPGPQRMKEIGKFETHDVEIEGAGWKEAAADIALRGLGWVSVTGAGTARVRIGVPEGIGISVRPPLMPFDIWEATARYTGGRAVRKGGKTKSGKTRKGVGRR